MSKQPEQTSTLQKPSGQPDRVPSSPPHLKSGFSRYFIALIPPSPIYEEAFHLKQYFKDQYDSRAALSSPPHITLHMPFEWKAEKESKVTLSLSEFASKVNPFTITLNDFGSFPPRVIYMRVEKSGELERMQRDLERFCKVELNIFNSLYRDLPYHPHLTLAFRDLSKPMFVKAWEEFQERKFSKDFLADKITLLRYDGKIWRVYKDFPLAG